MKSRQLLRYILFTRPSSRIAILLTSLLATFMGLMAPFLQKEYLDILLQRSSSSWLESSMLGLPPWILMIYSFICTLGYLLFSQYSNYLGSREAIWIQGDLSKKLYQQAVSLRTDSMEGRPVGELVSVYATDVSGAAFLLEQSLPTGASILFPLTLAPWALYHFFNVPILPIVLVMISLCALNFFMAYRQSIFFFKFKKLAAQRIAFVAEWIQNIRTLRILGWVKNFENKIYSVRVLETKNRVQMLTNGQTMNSISSSITFILNIMVVFLLVYQGKGPVSAGSLFALLWIVGVFLTRPFRSMPWVFTFIFDAWTSICRVAEFLSLKNIEVLNKRSEFQKISDDGLHRPILQVNNLNLKIGSTEILKSISFEVHRGEFIAIVGEVGSGKSSLLLSLLGESGAHFDEYRIMNSSAKDMPLSQLRQFYTFVPQEGFIMSATLRENVAFDYNVGRFTDDKILNSLKLAQFDLEKERLTDGLETEIGERGVNLSGGQKQRVSLARVDYYASPIVLLDDCLSALDVDTEDHLIHDLLQGAWKERTRILVTHRLTVLDEVDRILFLENGKIVASGSLVELLRTNPKFQTFAASVARQSGQNPPADSQNILPTDAKPLGENEEI